jgi:dTDP-4-dehydrorhamnose reductase
LRILLTGSRGQLGFELIRTLACLGEVVAVGRDRLDLEHVADLGRTVRELRPSVIVNAAAYTAVDAAETDFERALRINAEAPAALAREAALLGALFVHVSTDYVFDGSKATPYLEDDPTRPLNRYGESKRAGELAVQDAGGRYLILRTGWVYGLRGRNFLRTVLSLASEHEELRIVRDQRGAPTWSRLLAEAMAQIVARAATRGGPSFTPGIYHLTASGETSWHGFATAAVDLAERLGLVRVKARTITPIASADYPVPARRPANSRLDNARIEALFGIRMPAWDTALCLCLEEATGRDRGLGTHEDCGATSKNRSPAY